MDIINEMKKCDNKLLKSEAEDISFLMNIQNSSLSKQKKLQLLLKNSILDLKIQNGKRYICTSHEELVKRIAPLKKSEKNTIKETDNRLFKSNNDNISLAWDLLHSKYISIVGNRWEMYNFIVVRDENVNLLTSIINDLLRRPVKTI